MRSEDLKGWLQVNLRGGGGIASVDKDDAAYPVGVFGGGTSGVLSDQQWYSSQRGRGDIRISGYQACGCGMKSMHGGSEFTAEEGGKSILFTPWVSRGARDIDGNTQGQSGTAAVWYLP